MSISSVPDSQWKAALFTPEHDDLVDSASSNSDVISLPSTIYAPPHAALIAAQRSADTLAKQLRAEGIVVCKLDPAECSTARCLCLEYLKNIPEHRVQSTDPLSETRDFSAGSFGALNLPSSYHNPSAVFIDLMVRKQLMQDVLPQFADLCGHEFIEMVPDRLVFRTQRQKAESWHRDNTKGARSANEVYLGCIVNLNESLVQNFVAVPRTHLMSACLSGTGLEGSAYAHTYLQERSAVFEIPPGHCLLFFENILHRIVGATPRQPILRKMVGFRISNCAEPWNRANVDGMAKQGALVFKGGKMERLIPGSYINFYQRNKGKIEQYCQRLDPRMLTTYTGKRGKMAGITVQVPSHPPVSLHALGLKYPQTDEALTRFDPVHKQAWGRNEPCRQEFMGRVVTISSRVTRTMSDGGRCDIPNHFFCPITKDIMKAPVLAPDGHTYDKAAIIEWFDRNPGAWKSPVSGTWLETPPKNSGANPYHLVDNHFARHAIESHFD